MSNLEYFLKLYLQERPVFLSLIRAKEAQLFQKYLPLRKPILDYGCGDGFFASVTLGKKGLTRIESEFSQIKSGSVRIEVGLDMKNSRIGEAEKEDI